MAGRYQTTLVGRRFGDLTVIARSGMSDDRRAKWRCVCDCGGEVVRTSHSLRKSSGVPGCDTCKNRRIGRRNARHGQSRPSAPHRRLYRIWLGMRGRCENPNAEAYGDYGARGIFVCQEWQDFEAFRDWAIAHGYADALTIERRDSLGDYTPSNCEWITLSENSRRATVAAAAYRKLLLRLEPPPRRPHYPIEMLFGTC